MTLTTLQTCPKPQRMVFSAKPQNMGGTARDQVQMKAKTDAIGNCSLDDKPTRYAMHKWCPRVWLEFGIPDDIRHFIKMRMARYRHWAKDGCAEAAYPWANVLRQNFEPERIKVISGDYLGAFRSGVEPARHY